MEEVIYENQFEDEQEVPVEVTLDKWHWGGFLLGSIWGLGNGVWWPFVVGILLSIAVVASGIKAVTLLAYIYGLAIAFWFGKKGYEISWTHKKWSSIEHFQHVQKLWTKWGVGLLIGYAALVAIFVAIIVANL